MKWKPDVKIERNNGLWLCRGKKRIKVAEDDVLITEMIEEGITDDDALLKCLSEKIGDDEIGAGFSLAQFVEDYGDYIDEGKKARVFDL
ncbi:MAG: hypothetical protein IJ608_01495 [Lachnospiraceae bacterium]|nr:hypothetical protein [Lachnospiraceae bacterium]